MYILLLVIIYIAFTGMGFTTSLLGSAWPVIQPELNASLETASIVSMIISASTVVISLLADKVLRRLGVGILTAIGMAMITASMFGFALAGSGTALCALAVPLGIGTGAVDAVINNYVANHYSSRHMSWLHCTWSLGSVISPYIMGGFMANDNNWRGGYLAVAIIQAVITVIILATASVWKVNKTSFFKSEHIKEKDKSPISFRQIFRLKGIWYVLIAFTCYCAFQRTSMLWASSYLVSARGIAAKTAATYSSFVFLGVTAGRFLGGIVADKLGDRKMIRYGIYLTVLGVVMLVLPVKSIPLIIAGLITLGLGAAPGFPSIVHATPTNFGAEYSQAVIGVEIAFAYIGTTFMPSIFGFIAEKTTMALLPYYILFFALMMLLLTERFNRIIDKEKALLNNIQ